MKDKIPSLTWIEKRENHTWDCEEYPFRILPAQQYTVRHFELYDEYGNGKKYDGKFYAPINAMDFAKKIFRAKIKKGEFVYKKKEKKETKKKIYDEFSDTFSAYRAPVTATEIPRPASAPINTAVESPVAAWRPPTNEEIATAERINTQPMISSTNSELARIVNDPNAQSAASPIVPQSLPVNITLENGSTIAVDTEISPLNNESLAGNQIIPLQISDLQVTESSLDLSEFEYDGSEGEDSPF